MKDVAPGLDETRLRGLLAGVEFVRRLVVLESCGSTNDEARRLAGEGAEHGTVVVSSRQTAGRGRLGRRWASSPDTGLYLSVVVRPRDGVARATRWTLAAAVAGCAACRAASGAAVTIKWPNDLLVSGRKVAGILAELRAPAERVELVLGLGVNVLQRAEDFPPALRDRATSLRLGSPPGHDVTVERETVAAHYLERLGRSAARLEAGDWDTVAGEWLERAPGATGAAVRVVQRPRPPRGAGGVAAVPGAGAEWTGVTRGIDASGALLVERSGGAVEPIRDVDSIVEL